MPLAETHRRESRKKGRGLREEDDEEGVTAMVENPLVPHDFLLSRTLMALSVHSPGWP